MPGILTDVNDVARLVRIAQNVFGIKVSPEFLLCANAQLSKLFSEQTGIMSFKKVGLASRIDNLVYGTTSSFETSLFVNQQWQTGIRICWNSKSGRIYHLHELPDCMDIHFWYDNIDYDLLIKQLYGPDKLPFRLGKISFELSIGSISLIDLELHLFPKHGLSRDALISQVNELLEQLNLQSRQGPAYQGTIHDYSVTANTDQLLYEFDFGSGNLVLLKQLLLSLSKMNAFEKVILGHIQMQ